MIFIQIDLIFHIIKKIIYLRTGKILLQFILIIFQIFYVNFKNKKFLVLSCIILNLYSELIKEPLD